MIEFTHGIDCGWFFFLELWVRLSPFRCLCEVDLVTKSAVVWLELESVSFFDMSILSMCHVDRGVDSVLGYIDSTIPQIDCGMITGELSFLAM